MVLVDTSVWIDHLRYGNKSLAHLLNTEGVCMHPFVLGELACGNLQNRSELLSLFRALPPAEKVEDEEVLFFIEKNQLMGRGIGLVDMHLLASCRIQKSYLWTKDRRLKQVAEELDLGFGSH